MAIYGYTKNYKLIKPQFDTDTWHDYVYDNLDTIDAIMSAIYSSGNWQGFWKKNTHYDVGDVVIDKDTDTMYKVLVEHTTSENTFALEQAAHPTYYELWSPNDLAESWAIKMDGVVNYTDYSAKAYAISSALIDAGSAKEWAIKTDGAIGTTGEYSAKKHATDAASSASYADASATFASANAILSSQWAVSTTLVASTDYSSKSWATGSLDAGSAKDWAIKEGGQVGTTGKYSAKVYSLAAENHYEKARDWASKTNGQVESTDYSAKAYAISEGLISAGSAKEWSNKAKAWATSSTIVEDGKYGASYYALQAYNANVTAQIAKTTAQEWATKTDGTVDGVNYSSKYYAQQILPIATDIGTLAAISTDISATASISTDVSAVASNETNISAVATNETNINTVATNISDVNNAATHMADIQAAPTAASNAANSANNSQVWAEGTDEQVQALGGTHSAKEWANVTSGANKDLSNLTSAGEAHFANPALTNTGYTTNRIFEIPQDIKLELNSGTLTLKAGSKVYVPNGFEQDGTTPKFDEIVVENDLTTTGYQDYSCFILYRTYPNEMLTAIPISDCATVTSQPSAFGIYYDTSINQVYRIANNIKDMLFGFPIGVFTRVSGVITSIDQIFNGFGYIGSTVFALPGVKGQAPNGKYEDGTFKNVIYTTSNSVVTRTITGGASDKWIMFNGSNVYLNSKTNEVFDADSNYWKYDGVKQTNLGCLGSVYFDGTKISSFIPYNVDSVVNSNEFYQLKDNAVTLTDKQTIRGAKTFTSDIRISQSATDTALYLKDTGLESNATVPASQRSRVVRAVANNDTMLGDMRFVSMATGERHSSLYARKVIGSTTYTSNVSAVISSTGATYGTCPTPSLATENSTQIATTAWVNTANKTGKGIGAPNYSAAVDASIDSSTSYTAAANGWIQAEIPAPWGASNIYIDGVKIGLGYTQQNVYSTYQVALAPIAKGSTVTTNVSMTIKFIPCK